MSADRRITLADLSELCDCYVPRASRHPNSLRPGATDGWWPAHEIGHLLTAPRGAIGRLMFGLEAERPHDNDRCWAYELAAMSVSRRLLTACGRRDLFDSPDGELEASDYDVIHYGSRSWARRILRRHRALRLPSTRAALERKLQRVTAQHRAANGDDGADAQHRSRSTGLCSTSPAAQGERVRSGGAR